ncbi:hypothetical protein ACFWB0_05195 [Rhodococcus sp. NPDC060086]|uniref:hypothetical protein n=1 Tax=Rhodococcus sp. NPDC060086 TaxID=3347055 RepID=UPI003669A7EB
MSTTTRKSRLLALTGASVVVALTTVGCAGDGQSGIPTESPGPPAATETVTASPATTEAPAVPVGDVPGNAAAAEALQAWVNDLVSGNDVTAECWTIAPDRAEAMYSDVDAITAAVQRPGQDGQYAVTWSADGTDVSVLRSEIASGYACPYVHPAGGDIYTGRDAVYAVERFLGRATGDPVHSDDTEENYPLICPGREIWDPWGTGSPGAPPLSMVPDALGDVTTFDAESGTFSPLDEVYGSVTIPVVEAGTARDLVVYVTTASNGYCLGAVD